MPVTEYNGENSTQMLFEELKNIKNYDGLLFYSLLMLPSDAKRKELFI